MPSFISELYFPPPPPGYVVSSVEGQKNSHNLLILRDGDCCIREFMHPEEEEEVSDITLSSPNHTDFNFTLKTKHHEQGHIFLEISTILEKPIDFWHGEDVSRFISHYLLKLRFTCGEKRFWLSGFLDRSLNPPGDEVDVNVSITNFNDEYAFFWPLRQSATSRGFFDDYVLRADTVIGKVDSSPSARELKLHFGIYKKGEFGARVKRAIK